MKLLMAAVLLLLILSVGFKYFGLLTGEAKPAANLARLTEISVLHYWVLVEHRVAFLLTNLASAFGLAGFWLCKLVKPTPSVWALRLTACYALWLTLVGLFLVLGLMAALQHAAGQSVRLWDMQVLFSLPNLYHVVLGLLVLGLPSLLLLCSWLYNRQFVASQDLMFS